MIRFVIPVALLLMASSWLHAQTPQNITLKPALDGSLRVPCIDNDAGTIQGFGPFTGASNDVTLDTIYLCFGDTLPLIHNMDFSLNGDPIPGTPAGIAYVFYDDVPTVSGPNLAAVLADPALNTTSPLIINGFPFPQINGIWLAPSIDGMGNLNLINNGSLQEAYNGGVAAPTQFWFAPITVDNAANLIYENGGPCVSVSVDEAFSVVYLNAIELTEQFPSFGPGLEGAFVLRGGLSEFDPNTTYNITISDLDGNAVGNVLSANPSHGDTIRYTVPDPGAYEITVTDGKSCPLLDTLSIPVIFNVGSVNGPPGDTVCVPVTAENFVNITNFQFSMQWDPAELDFVSLASLTNQLPSFDQGIFNTSPAITNTGQLTMGWAEFLTIPQTLADGTLLFEVCFEVLGNIGDISDVDIVNSPTIIQAGNGNTGNANIPVLPNNGQVNVTNSVIFVQAVTDSVSCAGLDDGQFTLTVTGGTAPYTYTWNTLPPSGPDENGTIPSPGIGVTEGGLAEGVYRVIVSDSEMPANMDTLDLQIFEGPALGLSLVETQPTCNGFGDGRLTARITLDGVEEPNPGSGFTFVWSTGDTSQVIDSLAFQPQAYSVTVTDENGCTATASTTLSQPGELRVLAQNTNIQDATCSGAMDGVITVGATGGTNSMGNYFYQWAGEAVDTAAISVLPDLEPGTYDLTVTDANGCSIERSFTVGATKLLGINLVDSTHVRCNGGSDGFLSVNGTSSGQPPFGAFTYSWTVQPSGQALNGASISGLTAGQYILTLTDQDPLGCQAVDTFNIGQPDSLLINLISLANESCTGGGAEDGAITVSASGGTAPYTYSWSNMETDSSITGLSAGDYTLDVEDANGCMRSQTFTITAPNPPLINTLLNDTLACADDTDGALSVLATPAGAPITAYAWSNGQSGPDISGLSPGVYFVTVSAADGCEAVDSALVVAPAPITIDSIGSNSPLCVGQSDGSLRAFVSGGTPPYTYIWAGSSTTNVLFPGLTAGTYSLVVEDANGCTPAMASAEVVDPPAIVISFSDIDPTSCFEGSCDGQATASAMYANGDTALFNFVWESGEIELSTMMSTATELCRDSQTVVVTDPNGCVATNEVIVPSPDAIVIDLEVSNVSCAGEQDGTALASPSGGTGAFDFNWPDLNETTPSVANLAAGEYTVVVTDANGCEQDQVVQITEPEELVLMIDPVNTQSISCFGEEDGQIGVTYNFNDNINPVGPNPFTFSANVPAGSGSTATGFADGLSAGAYTVIITDVRGCQDSVSISLTEPTEIMAVIPDPEDPPCFDATTLLFIDTIFGGAGTTLDDYRYMVDGNGVLLTPDVPADLFGDGEHSVEIFDPNGCTAVFFVEISQPEEITVTFPQNFIEVELGDSTTRLQPIISPFGTQIDSFIWTPATYLSSPSVENPIVFPFESLEYTLQVVDVNGCTASGRIFVDLNATRNIFIPNAFSPNGDGVNDEFRIYPCNGVTRINGVMIYDRWGNQVYQGMGAEVSRGLFCAGGLPLWNGENRGERMNMGVYVYVIEVEFLDGERLLYRGDVNLVR